MVLLHKLYTLEIFVTVLMTIVGFSKFLGLPLLQFLQLLHQRFLCRMA